MKRSTSWDPKREKKNVSLAVETVKFYWRPVIRPMWWKRARNGAREGRSCLNWIL